jgi:putative MFS transporter
MTAKSLSRSEAILARLEQMPFTRFHMRLRLIVGAATFFDLFDAIMIAFVAPALIRPWSLSPPQIGLLISAAYAGQFVGALFFGWLAGRIGRRRTILLTTVCYGIGSLLVAGAWDFESMLVLRALQGIGLGGEVPVASAYLSEWIAAESRGRYVAFFELTAPVGILAAGLLGAWVVPEFGWRWMFVIGAVPALLVFPLRRQMPESPRHLIRMGKFDEAERIVAEIEREPNLRSPQPPRPEFQPVPDRPRSGRFRQILIVGGLWFCCYFINYGLTGWLPSIYRSVYHLDVGASLRYGLATSAAGVVGAVLCGLLIDRIGRRIWFAGAFLLGGAPLVALALMPDGGALDLLALGSLSYIFVSGCSAALYLYTPEIFPTRNRTLGTGAGSACARVASATAPLLVGAILSSGALTTVFALFGAMALAGALFSLSLIETAKRPLEAIFGVGGEGDE